MSKQFIKSKKRLSRYLAALVAIGSIPTVNVYAEEVNEIESPSTVIEENIHTEEEEIEGINELMQSDESSETTITSDESSESTITPEESQIILEESIDTEDSECEEVQEVQEVEEAEITEIDEETEEAEINEEKNTRESLKYNPLSGTIENKFVQASISDEGRFTIGTTGGNPNKDSDNNQTLLFGHPSPGTSYTSFILDGEVYEYSQYSNVQSNSNSHISKNLYGDIELTQHITID